MRILLAVLLCAFVAIVKVESNEVDTSIECLINYLRQQKYDDDAFDSIATFSTLSDACKRRIRSEMDLVFILAHQKYEAKQEYQKYLECFMESIKNDENFLHLLLKRKAIESIKLSWKAKLNPNNWIPGKKHKGLKNVGKAIDEIEFENLFVCEYGKKFAEAFEIIFEPHKINLRSVDEVQCMRMEPNASKIALEATERSLNCDDVLADARVNVMASLLKLYSDKKRSARNCITAELISEDYFSPHFKAETFMRSFKQEEKENERKAYVASMMSLFRKVFIKCR